MHAATCGQQPSVVAPSLPSNHSPWPASTAARNMMPGWRSFCGKAAAISVVEWSYITASMQAAPGTRLSLRTLSCLASAILSARRLFTPPCAHRSAPSTHHEGQQVHALVLRLLQQRVDPAVIALWGWQAGNGRIWRVSERSAASTRQCVAAAGQGQAVMLLHAGEPQQQVPPLPAAGVPPPWPGSPLTHGPQRAHVAQHACRAQQGRGRPGSC